MIKIISIFIDIILVSAGELLAFLLRFGYPLPESEISHYWANWVLIVIIRIWAIYSVKLYLDKFKSYFLITNAIIRASALSTIFITAVTFFNRTLSYPRSVILLSFILTLILLLIKYYFYWEYYIVKKSRKHVVIIGANEAGKNVVKGVLALRHWEIIGFIDEKIKIGQKIVNGLQLIGSLKDLKKLIKQKDINLAVIALPKEKIENKLRVLALCEELGLEYVIIPSFYEIVTGRAKLDEIDDMAIIEPGIQNINWVNKILKRSFDIIFSLIILIILIPIFIIIGLLIKLSSPGPIVYLQKRSGQNGKPFYVYKFRTMIQNADKIGPLLTDKNDNRILWIGKFLRRFSLDEILQFYNILKGDMSVVGPRPEVIEIVKEYKEWQQKVLRVKPGLTGLAQISGRQELDLDTKLKLDLYYINNYSLLLDLEIVFKTIFVVLHGKGAN